MEHTRIEHHAAPDADSRLAALADAALAPTDLNAALERVAALESRVEELERGGPKDGATIVVSSEDLDKLLAAFTIATGAASMGTDVNLFFTRRGLGAIKKARSLCDETLPQKLLATMLTLGRGDISKVDGLGVRPRFLERTMQQKNVQRLGELIALAVDLDVKMVACRMSMHVMGMQPDGLIDGLGERDVAACLSGACESRVTLFV